MVCATGFTVGAQSASQDASSPKTITGVVVSAFDKEPLKGVYVRLKGTNIGVATDIDGHFNIEAQLGDTLSVKVLDCDEIEVAVDAQQLRISLFNFVSGWCCGDNLPKGVFGTVCNEDEKALQGATVTALPSGNSVVTDSKGYFNITKIKESDKSLRVEHPSYKTIQGRISGNCFEIWLERNIVTGQVLSAEDGEPVIGAHICANGTKNGTATDFDGKFSIEALQNDTLQVTQVGYEDAKIVVGTQPLRIVLMPPKIFSFWDIAPLPGLSGVVMDEDSILVVGATVTVLPSGKSVTTDSNGYFHIPKIGENDDSIKFEHPNYKSLQGGLTAGNTFKVRLERNNDKKQVSSFQDIDKIIISHIGMEDKPLWTVQISYKPFGDIFNKETKHLFYYGTTYRDSIKWVILSCDSLDLKSYERIKSLTIDYPNKYTERSSLPGNFEYGDYCISIVEKGVITRYYFTRIDAIKLLDEYIYILVKDPKAEDVERYLETLAKRLRR